MKKLILIFILSIFYSYGFCIINQKDSLHGFNEKMELDHIKSHGIDSSEFEHYIHLAKKRFIKKKYNLGFYGPAKRIKSNSSLDCDIENWGFEDGTFSGWIQQGAVEITDNGTDPYGGYSWVYPNGGNFSAKVSSDLDCCRDGRLDKVINVPSSGTTLMSFHFAMSIFNYPHTSNQAAKLWVEFYDGSGSLLPCPQYECYYSTDLGAVGVNNFQQTPNPASFYNPLANGDGPSIYPVTYADWNTVTLDLSSYQGQQLTAVFRVEWCIPGPDWAYVLLDVDCPVNTFEPEYICLDENSQDTLCGPDNMLTYSWYDPAGTLVGSDKCLIVNSPGTYRLETLPDDVECNSATLLTFNFNVDPPLDVSYLVSDYNGYNLSCNGYNDGSIDLSVSGGSGTYNFNWSTGSALEDQSQLLAGTYNVEITDMGSCSSTANFELTEPPKLSTSINFLNDTCNNFGGMAEVIAFGGVSPYTYLWLDGHITSTINNLSGGDYSITVIDDNNCEIVDQFYIEPAIFEAPNARFDIIPDFKLHDLKKQLKDPIHFIDVSYDKYNTISKWYWQFEDGFFSNEQNIRYSFQETGDFNITLIVENIYGCIDTISKTVIVEEFILYIPNSFTPQDDEINDTFLPKGVGVINYELKIYNRSGDHIFTSNDLNIGWDGSMLKNKKIVQTGVYVYTIKLTDVFGKDHSFIGQVNLIK